MQKITKTIDEALKLISTLTVSGDAVDVVAAAKSLLRNANTEIKKLDITNNEVTE